MILIALSNTFWVGETSLSDIMLEYGISGEAELRNLIENNFRRDPLDSPERDPFGSALLPNSPFSNPSNSSPYNPNQNGPQDRGDNPNYPYTTNNPNSPGFNGSNFNNRGVSGNGLGPGSSDANPWDFSDFIATMKQFQNQDKIGDGDGLGGKSVAENPFIQMTEVLLGNK